MQRLTELISNTEQSNKQKQSHVSHILAKGLKKVEREKTKLQLISNELSKLDSSLSRNIGILRSEIESVHREVSMAQADFDRKERDYMIARDLLAKKKQRKLLLTGHLDYIILTNERNKATKLEQLELQLKTEEEDHTDSHLRTVTTAGTMGTANRNVPGNPFVNGSATTTTTARTNPKATPPKPAFTGFSAEEIQNFDL